jgi:dynein heavy chain, axonemal
VTLLLLSWANKAWPSLRPLASWIGNFSDRLNQLDEWATNPVEIPRVTWLSGLVNPTSFLTAICQVTAQRNMWELDKLVTFTDVTKRMSVEEIESASRDGAYIIGLSMQGARWDPLNLQVEPSRPKEMFCPMPIINVKAVTKEKANVGGIYSCPVYTTELRGPTWFFNAQLRTKSNPARWVLAGVALIADVAS